MKNPIKAFCIVLLLFAGGVFYIQATESPDLKDAVELARNGKQSEAIAAIRIIIARNPGGEAGLQAHLSLGIIYFKSHQYDLALGEFESSIAIRNDNPMAYYFSGLIYEEKARTPGLSAGQSTQFKKMALAKWQAYLDVTNSTTMTASESHKHIGITRAESIEGAKQHIKVLTEELEHEKN